MAHARVAFALGVCLATGCSAAAPAPSATSPVPSAAEADVGSASFEGRPWAPFHSKRFELSVRLPDGPAWRIDDHRTPFLRATHSGTHSKLALRSWREDANVTRSGCYARARGWDATLPDLDAARLVDDATRPLFDKQMARVAVGLVGTPVASPTKSASLANSDATTSGDAQPAAPPMKSASLPANGDASSTKGFVVAVMGDVKRCFLLVYETEATGPSAENDIAERLAVVADRLLLTLKLDQSFAPSRDPAIPAPPGGAGGVR